jgi:uncharacterized membrane protein
VTKLEFIAAFRLACDTLPVELVDTALAGYERQFTDQFLSGVSEQVIVERWGTPQHAALKLKLSTLNGNLKKTVSVERVARVGMNGVGLALMDFLLCIPAMIYLALLSAFYIAALIVYLTGIFVSASSLAGVNYIDVPAHYLLHDFAMKGSTHFNIGNIDIVPTELVKEDEPVLPEASKEPGADHTPHFLHDRGFHIATHLNKETIWKGISTTLAGMVLLVLCFLATRFTFRMIRQFVAWHFSVLKNA